MNKETPIMREIRSALMATGLCLLWRNNAGMATYGKAKVKYGIGRGGADYVGILIPFGLFLGVEVKTPEGELSDDQRAWRKTVIDAGGVYICSAEPGEALTKLGELCATKMMMTTPKAKT